MVSLFPTSWFRRSPLNATMRSHSASPLWRSARTRATLSPATTFRAQAASILQCNSVPAPGSRWMRPNARGSHAFAHHSND